MGPGADGIYWLAMFDSFTHAVELIRFAAQGQFNALAAMLVAETAPGAFSLAAVGHDPNREPMSTIRRP